MSLKESLKVLQALNALPRKDAEEVVEAWMDQVPKEEMQPSAKTARFPAKKRFTRSRFQIDEIDFIKSCLGSGLSQNGTAREAKVRFNRRSLNAYEHKVNDIAKELRNDN